MRLTLDAVELRRLTAGTSATLTDVQPDLRRLVLRPAVDETEVQRPLGAVEEMLELL